MYRKIIGLLSLGLITVTQAGGWEEKFYNPKALPDDVILPMPCEGKMVFRIVKTNTQKPLEDSKIVLGGTTDTEGYAEFATKNYIAGGFANPQKARYFLMAKYEVTHLQYQAVMQDSCPKVTMKGLLPMTQVSWFDAVAFSRRYSEWLLKNAPSQMPAEDGVKGFIRLPTNTEWEFASRGGVAVSASEFRESTFPTKDGLKAIAWFNDSQSANGRLQLIGRLSPNPLGIFDTLGNASEMMFEPFRANKLNRYHGQASGMIVRGGSYLKSAAEVNNVSRLEQPYFSTDGSAKKAKDMGFRVVVSAPLLTSSTRIKALDKAWKALGQDTQSIDSKAQDNHNIVGKLETLAKKTEDKALKQELTATKDKLRAANQAREEQRNVAIQSALELGAFLCSNISDLHAEVLQNQQILDVVKSLYADDESKLKKAQARLSESQKAQNFTLKYYADTIVSVSTTYAKPVIKSQVTQTKNIISGHGEANLSQYIELYWQQVEKYYHNGRINREQWLEQCTQIKGK